MALLLAVSSWTADRPGLVASGETDEAAKVLTAAGWRVATVTADMPLSVAWDVLNRTHLARGGPVAGAATRPADGATATAGAVAGAATGTAASTGEAGGLTAGAAPPTGAGANR